MENRSAYALRSRTSGQLVEIGNETIVGRHSECDFVISEGEVSRRHAKLLATDAGLLVEDLGSSNGTFVNERRIQAAEVVHDGDVLRFDQIAFEVVAPGKPAASESDRTVVHAPDVLVAQAEVARKPGGWVDPGNVRAGTSVMSQDEVRRALADMGTAESERDAAGTPQLRITAGRQQGTVINLDPTQSRWTIGSDPDRDIMLDDPGVSRQHAEISSVNGRWKLVDQMSANGTFVNDERAVTAFLASGDRIRFGSVDVVVDGLGAARSTKSGGRGSARTWLIVGAVIAIAIVTGALLALR
jgi:pSer/pThr/pTyr-binding forkhead associated (FHA) protein